MTFDRSRSAEADSAGGPDALLVNSFFFASVVYTLLFNHLDDGTRTAIAGVLGIVALARCLMSWPNPASVLSTFLLLALLAVPLTFFIFSMDPRDQNGSYYATLLLRMGTCLAVPLVFTHGPRAMSPNLLVASSALIILTAVLVAATGKETLYAETIRPASFTGGIEGVHSTGYVLIAVLLGIGTLWRCGWLSVTHALLLTTPLVLLIVLFQVRTTWTMGLAYLLATALCELRARDRRGAWLAPVLFLAAAGLLAYVASLGSDYAEFSSGRTAAYAERIEMILSRDLAELLFGTGAGSELITNGVWWWAAKNSHNDFLDITIQTGVIGLALLIAMLVIISTRLDRFQMPLFIAFIVSSMISNGLLGRPFIAVLLLAFLLVPLRRETTQEAGAPTPFCLSVREA
jgi:O-antigen ligase